MGDGLACTRCGHDRSAHGRYRAGMDCLACDCLRFRPDPPLRDRYRQYREARELARAERVRQRYPRYVIVGNRGAWSAAHLDSWACFGPARTVRRLAREIGQHALTTPAAPEPQQVPVTPPGQADWRGQTMLDFPPPLTRPYTGPAGSPDGGSR